MKSIIIIIFCISLVSADNYLSELGGFIGLGTYNNYPKVSLGLQLKHQPAFSDKFQYIINGLPTIYLFSDKYNNNKLNLSLGSICGFIDFTFEFTEGPLFDWFGLSLAAIDGIYLYNLNDKISIIVGNSIRPVLFGNQWWQGVAESGFQYDSKLDTNSNYYFLRVSFCYDYRLQNLSQNLIGINLTYGGAHFR